MFNVSKQETLSRIFRVGLVAVLRGPDPDTTLKMVAALVAGGVEGIEITYTTPRAAEVVATLDRTYGDRIVLGMGTLIEPAQAAEAQAAGARYLVSPHCEPALAQAMLATGLPAFIGALTPTEVMQAHKLGADVIKIFPGSLAGPDYLKSLRGPFPAHSHDADGRSQHGQRGGLVCRGRRGGGRGRRAMPHGLGEGRALRRHHRPGARPSCRRCKAARPAGWPCDVSLQCLCALRL